MKQNDLAVLGLATLILLVAIVALTPTADAAGGAGIPGCAKLTHASSSSPSSATHFRVSLDSDVATAACSTQAHTLLEGECLTFNIKYVRNGALAPADPQSWEIYWYFGTTEQDHGTSGATNWAQWRRSHSYIVNPTGGTVQFCATENGSPSTTPLDGTWRLVLRSCRASVGTPSSCDGVGSVAYQINSDENPTCACSGNPGAGFTANGHPSSTLTTTVPDYHDPLEIGAPAFVYVGDTVNWSIGARFDYGDFRTGAASDILAYAKAPDGTYVQSGVTPTESTFPGAVARVGHYYTSFTASQSGDYYLMARLVSDDRSTWPVVVRVLERPITLNDMLTLWGTVNGTARTQHLANVHNDLRTSANDTTSATATLTNNHHGRVETRLNETTDPLPTNAELATALSPLATAAGVTSATAPLALQGTSLEILGTARGIDANVTSANNSASGDLRLVDFNIWNATTFIPHRDESAREATLTTHGATTTTEHTALDANDDAHNASRHADEIRTYQRVDDARTITIDGFRAGAARDRDHEANMTVHLSTLHGSLDHAHERLDQAQGALPYAAGAAAILLLMTALLSRSAPRRA